MSRSSDSASSDSSTTQSSSSTSSSSSCWDNALLPTHYVPVGSKNQRHLKNNINLQYFRRLVKERQEDERNKKGRKSSRSKRKFTADDKNTLIAKLHQQLQLVHDCPQLPELVFVVGVNTPPNNKSTALEEYGGRYYRRALEQTDGGKDEVKAYMMENQNFKEFLAPLDDVLVQEALTKADELPCRQQNSNSATAAVTQFQALVQRLRETLQTCQEFRDIMEEDFIKIINEAWDTISSGSRLKKNKRKRKSPKRSDDQGGKGDDASSSSRGSDDKEHDGKHQDGGGGGGSFKKSRSHRFAGGSKGGGESCSDESKLCSSSGLYEDTQVGEDRKGTGATDGKDIDGGEGDDENDDHDDDDRGSDGSRISSDRSLTKSHEFSPQSDSSHGGWGRMVIARPLSMYPSGNPEDWSDEEPKKAMPQHVRTLAIMWSACILFTVTFATGGIVVSPDRPRNLGTPSPTGSPLRAPTASPVLGRPSSAPTPSPQGRDVSGVRSPTPTNVPPRLPMQSALALTAKPADSHTPYGARAEEQAVSKIDHPCRSLDGSADWRTVAAGTVQMDVRGYDFGSVHLYRYDETRKLWNLQIVQGDAAGDGFGDSVALSADGEVMAVGATQSNGDGADAGYVRVFSYNNLVSGWDQRGVTLVGEAAGDSFGGSMALSGDGSALVVGSIYNDDNGKDSGNIRVFEYGTKDNTWMQKGQSLTGLSSGDEFGWAVALSADGSAMAAGAKSGYVRVFWYDGRNDEWKQLGQDIRDTVAGDRFGHSLAISADVTTLVVGTRNDDGTHTESVHMFGYDSLTNKWSRLEDSAGSAWTGMLAPIPEFHQCRDRMHVVRRPVAGALA